MQATSENILEAFNQLPEIEKHVMVLKWLKRFLLWIIDVVLIALTPGNLPKCFLSCALLVSILCQGCIVSESITPPIKTPAILIQRVLGTVEYVCCVKNKWGKPLTIYKYEYFRFGFVIFDPKLYNELRPAPYFPTVPDYNHEFIWWTPCSDCMKDTPSEKGTNDEISLENK